MPDFLLLKNQQLIDNPVLVPAWYLTLYKINVSLSLKLYHGIRHSLCYYFRHVLTHIMSNSTDTCQIAYNLIQLHIKVYLGVD